MISHIPGIRIGHVFLNRRALHDAGVHRGLRQGVASDGSSIVMPGRYIDDEDSGDVIYCHCTK